jgi:hypothetical protein
MIHHSDLSRLVALLLKLSPSLKLSPAPKEWFWLVYGNLIGFREVAQ